MELVGQPEQNQGERMTPRNVLATLPEYKAYAVARGQTANISTDTADDAVLEAILEAATGYIEDNTQRQFTPFIETRRYDVPQGRELRLDAPLLEVITLTNGDGTVLTTTEYHLEPRNASPYGAIKINELASYSWLSSPSIGSEDAISLLAIFGFHNKYAREGWKLVSTTTEALDDSELGIDVTTGQGARFSSGKIIRIENEICIVDSVATDTLTVLKRGDNGSTAVAHDTAKSVYVWQPMPTAKNAVLEITRTAAQRRLGKSLSNVETVTAAGIVLTPRDIPAMAAEFIQVYKNYL
jgi:hypothetical protein